MNKKPRNRMDRPAWILRIQGDSEWNAWDAFLREADKDDDGKWTIWTLNILAALCDACGCPASPHRLPMDAKVLRATFNQILAEKSAQSQCRAIRMIRRVLNIDERYKQLLDVLPRHRREEPVNRIARQRRLVLEDALPRKGLTLWVRDLFREILDHPASGNWRTSKTANQNFNLIHKFLRSTGLLNCGSLQEFHERRTTLNSEKVLEMCRGFTDTMCASAASAKRYLVVFNHIFHSVWKMIPEKVKAVAKRRKVRTLQDLDDQLSKSSVGSGGSGHTKRRDYFDDAELNRIRAAAASGPTRLRDNLLVSLLESTGLRRMGALNILVDDIAERENGENTRWVAHSTSRTLTKGLAVHTFKLHQALRNHVQLWLNTAEAEGGRPCGPSPFLLPSNTTDNGQMSTSHRLLAHSSLGWAPEIDSITHFWRHLCARRICRGPTSPFACHAPQCCSQFGS